MTYNLAISNYTAFHIDCQSYDMIMLQCSIGTLSMMLNLKICKENFKSAHHRRLNEFSQTKKNLLGKVQNKACFPKIKYFGQLEYKNIFLETRFW